MRWPLDSFARAYDPSTILQALNLQAAGSSLRSVASHLAVALQNDLKPLGQENVGTLCRIRW
jgi:hypothetical protein